MLKKINKKKEELSSREIRHFENLPKSKKIYLKGNIYKNVEVGMRQISLEDSEIKNIVVYDTSGAYTDDKYVHSYEDGLKKVRKKWLGARVGIEQVDKTKLKYLDHSKCEVKNFPRIPKKFLRKKQMKLHNYIMQETTSLPRKWSIVQ